MKFAHITSKLSIASKPVRIKTPIWNIPHPPISSYTSSNSIASPVAMFITPWVIQVGVQVKNPDVNTLGPQQTWRCAADDGLIALSGRNVCLVTKTSPGLSLILQSIICLDWLKQWPGSNSRAPTITQVYHKQQPTWLNHRRQGGWRVLWWSRRHCVNWAWDRWQWDSGKLLCQGAVRLWSWDSRLHRVSLWELLPTIWGFTLHPNPKRAHNVK